MKIALSGGRRTSTISDISERNSKCKRVLIKINMGAVQNPKNNIPNVIIPTAEVHI